jgi:hypothetical protein
MQLDLNNLGYGNPSLKQLKKARRRMRLIRNPNIPWEAPPKNNSLIAAAELKHLQELQERWTQHDFLSLVNAADEDLEGVYRTLMGEYGVSYDGYYEQLFDDLSTLTIRMKIEYNRMRPYQLANILNVPMYPMNSESAHSASYPSGHTLQSYVVSEMLAEQVPEMAEDARGMASAVALSRKIGGWHYPSDNAYSKKIGDAILPSILRPEEV